MRRDWLLAACAAVLLVFPHDAGAQRWIGGGGNWDEKSNWLPAQLPTDSTGVEIDGNPKIPAGVASSLRAELGTLEEASGIVTVIGTGAEWGNSREILGGVRRKSTGGVEVRAGGKVIAGGLGLAWAPLSEGSLEVSGSGSIFSANGMDVGRAGIGRAKVDDGGKLSLGGLTVGALPGSLGEMLVTGATTTMDVDVLVRVGYGGSGQVALDSRAQAKTANVVVGGGTPGTGDGQPGIGRVQMSGRSSWVSSGSLVVGSISGPFAPFSEGYVTIDSGASFSAATHARIGLGSKGEVTITGVGSRLAIGTGALDDSYIGLDAAAKLSVLNGAVASFDNARLFLGNSPTGPATVVVDGPGSMLTSTGLITVTVNGAASATVDNGAKLVAPSVRIDTRPLGGGLFESGRVVLRGGADPALRGALETALVSGPGVLEFDGGILRATAPQPNLVQPGIAIASRGAFIDSNGYDIGIQRTFGGIGGLTKLGDGKLTLGASGSTYLGVTTIERGILAVDGSVASDVLVTGLGVLMGTGSIGGTVSVEAGGLYAPGSSPGKMTVGALSMLSGSVLEMEVGSTNDLVVVLGNVSLAGTLKLLFLPDWPPLGGKSVLLDVRGAHTGFFDDVVDSGLPTGAGYNVGFDGSKLIVTAVPEPTAGVLMLAGLALVAALAACQRSGSTARLRFSRRQSELARQG